MKIDTEKFIKHIENRLTDVNTGSYECDDCGEDYFDDALNLDEVIEEVTIYCTEFNNAKFRYDEFISKINNIQIEWDTNPFEGFYSFKEDAETLDQTLEYVFEDMLQECLI